jgi:hypothetical protein
VAISGDGNTIAVGSPREFEVEGLVSIFTRSEGTWTLQARLRAHNFCEISCHTGIAVGLSADGSELAFLTYNQVGGGELFLASRSGSTWTQEALSVRGLPHIAQVQSVALSPDGNTALIGGLETVLVHEPCRGQPQKLCEYETTGHVGLVLAFTRSGTAWQEQTLTGTGESGEGDFGSGAALSLNGETALIGGSADNSGVGAAWVFKHSASGWTQQGEKLTADNEIGAGEFGSSVAVSADGSKALIGGPGDNRSVGAAWEFTRSGETWIQQPSKLTASDETGEGRYASSLALSEEGDEAVIGAPGDGGGVGALWSFGPEPQDSRHHR